MNVLTWLETSFFVQLLTKSEWGYPIVEIFHLIGMAILVGASFMFDLRILGFSTHIPITKMAKHLLPWAWVGFSLVFITGGLLFSVNARLLVDNIAFQVKMLLLIVIGLNVLLFHLTARKIQGSAEDKPAYNVLHKCNALVSLLLWMVTIALGRLIAYV
ncbi:hypothetical protein Q0N84_16450 [Priestia megaterium]